MPEHTDTAQYLTDFLNQHLEAAQYLGMRVQSYDGNALSLSIDLKPSLNDKLTAWGGSLYGLVVMNAWGLFYLKCRERGINPNIVVSHAEIDYLIPVTEPLIVAKCEPIGLDWQALFAQVEQTGRASVSLSATVYNCNQPAVNFSGSYTLIGIKTSP